MTKAEIALTHNSEYKKKIQLLIMFTGTYSANKTDEKVIRAILQKLIETLPDIPFLMCNQRELAERASITDRRVVGKSLNRIFLPSEISTSNKGTQLDFNRLLKEIEHTYGIYSSSPIIYKEISTLLLSYFLENYNHKHNSHINLETPNQIVFVQKSDLYLSLASRNGISTNLLLILSSLIVGRRFDIKSAVKEWKITAPRTQRILKAFHSIGILRKLPKKEIYIVKRMLFYYDLLELCRYFKLCKYNKKTHAYVFKSEKVAQYHNLERIKYYYMNNLKYG